jgi:hypothetical protein
VALAASGARRAGRVSDEIVQRITEQGRRPGVLRIEADTVFRVRGPARFIARVVWDGPRPVTERADLESLDMALTWARERASGTPPPPYTIRELWLEE